MEKNKLLLFFILSGLLFYLASCSAKKHFSGKLKNSPVIGIHYEKGDIIIAGERNFYARHNTKVSSRTKYYRKVPGAFESELTESVLKGLQGSFPASSIQITETLPVKILRTLKGKSEIPDFSKIEQDILIIWKFDIQYSCRKSYYIDKCKGDITARFTLRDAEGNKMSRTVYALRRPLYYINPETESVEETEEIIKEIKAELPGAIQNFMKEFMN